jgi:hypothetical protein
VPIVFHDVVIMIRDNKRPLAERHHGIEAPARIRGTG